MPGRGCHCTRQMLVLTVLNGERRNKVGIFTVLEETGGGWERLSVCVCVCGEGVLVLAAAIS